MFFRVADPLAADLLPSSEGSGVRLRTTARSLAVMQKEALIGSSRTGAVWRVASDEGAYLMGDDVAPCPLAFMSVGMIASVTDHIFVLAQRQGVRLDGCRIIQDNCYTMQGSALKGTMAGGALPVDLRMEVDASEGRDTLEALLEDAVAASPVSALLGEALHSRFTLTHNGREIEPHRAASLGEPAGPRPAGCFEGAQPASGDWEALVRRNGMSPRTSEATSHTGSSYAEDQSRRLHLRAICSLRPDGLKTIEQQLLNPHGSIFHFLSEEGSVTGQGPRAPDALTYLSAGIAFCFLTQFGRYAKIVRKNLKEYSVVQETRFTPGGHGTAPSADAVGTHVYLESDEDDEFARRILDMAEQTCFLHALCRSELRVNPTVTAGTSSAGS